MNPLEVAIPTETLKAADKMIESALRITSTLMEALTFEFKCGKCDEMHEAGMSQIVIAALVKANIDHHISKYGDEKDDHAIEAINLYAAIFRQLWEGNTANAQLLQEQIVEMMKKDLAEDPPLVDDDAVAGILTLTIEPWFENAKAH